MFFFAVSLHGKAYLEVIISSSLMPPPPGKSQTEFRGRVCWFCALVNAHKNNNNEWDAEPGSPTRYRRAHKPPRNPFLDIPSQWDYTRHYYICVACYNIIIVLMLYYCNIALEKGNPCADLRACAFCGT